MTTFLVLLLAYMLSQFFRAFLAVTAADLTRDLGLDAAQLGSLSAAWLIGFALAQFPVGYAMDRAGPRPTLVGFMSAAVVGAAWLSRAQGYGEALAALALIGAGCAPILVAGFYLAGRLYPVRHFATLSSLLIGFGSLGDPLSGAPLGLALSLFGWRDSVMGLAGITALSTALLATLRYPAPPGGAGRQASFLGGIGQVVRTRALWRLLPLVVTSYAVVISIRGLWVVPYLRQVHGYDATEAGLAAMAMGFAMAAGALLYVPAQALAGSPKRAVLVGTAVTTCACLALGWAGGSNAVLAVELMVAIGVFGLTYATLMAHARAFMAADAVGRGVTFMTFCFMGGAGVTQWLSGRFVRSSEVAGLEASVTFGRMFVGFGVVLAVALAIYATSRPGPVASPIPRGPAP